jgi:segregation and condensation protein B
MEDSPQPRPSDSTSEPAEGLARSYRAFVGDEVWDTDVGGGEGEAVPETSTTTPVAPPSLVQLLEALLFVGGAPLTAEQAAAVIRGLTPAQFSQAIASLNRDYRRQGRPYLIQVQGQGYCLTLRPRFRPVLDRLYGQIREARLSPPAIDVLSLVAYRQPVTKQEIDSLRGAESGALIRQLVRRNLIAVVQRGEAGRREIYYGTTPRFLELFQLSSLDDLPQTADLQRL